MKYYGKKKYAARGGCNARRLRRKQRANKKITREDRRVADTNPPMAGGQAVHTVCLPLRVRVVVPQSVTEA